MEPRENADAPGVVPTVRQIEDAERKFFAGYYAEHRYHPTGWRLRLEREVDLLRTVASGRTLGRVLSVGCGDGEFELMLAPRADFVLGIDLSPEAIAVARDGQARRGISNVEFRCTSVADLPLDDRFDTVVCLAFLHHLPAAALVEFLTALHGLLEPGGLFYAQDPNVHGILRLVGRQLLGQRYDAYHSPDERELDPADLVQSLAAAGFADITVRYIDLTLIPALFALADGPDVVFRICAIIDRLWCASPLARWASGFSTIARKSAAPAEHR
jgi:2-polyprenyl-3-methyl-5-hydroxy-6-metoxy-1,4-benzoquinol methylase